MAAFSRVPMITVPFESAQGDAAAPLGAPAAVAAAPAPVDEERTLLGIRQARDLVLARNRELIDKLAAAEDQIAEITYERDDMAGERQEALRQVAALAQENQQLQAKVAHLGEQLASLSAAEQIYVMARGDIEAQLGAMTTERDAALAALAAREDKLETLRTRPAGDAPPGGHPAELDPSAGAKSEHEALIAKQAAELSEAQEEAGRARNELAALEDRRAEEKLVLEARIAALEAQIAKSAASATAAKKQHPASQKKGVSRLPPPPPPAAATPAPAPARKPLTDAELRDAVAAIRRGIESVQVQPVAPESLAPIEDALRELAERSAGGGFNAVHHLCALGCEVAARLGATPARIPAALPVLLHSTGMLGWLAMRGRELTIDLAGALVYAVDDDVDNCECVATALEKVAVLTKYSVRPDAALEQIAANRCDLIVLDVDLPGMDGFELHSRIRALPGCAETPIIFLSGHLSTAERLAALGDEHSQFAPKPYNLGELTLRILSSIVEARLG